MGSSVQIGRVFGIPIYINYSWIIIFALITFSLAVGQFPAVYPGWDTVTYWVIGFVTSLLFFGSVLLHELSHSVVARGFGIPVASITLFIFGGVSSIEQEATKPRDEFVMAVAGPLSSVGIAIVSLAIALGTAGIAAPIAAMFNYLWVINLLLAAFNLIPGFPLDGGRALRAALWQVTNDFRRATRIAGRTGVAIAYGFIVIGIWVALTVDLFSGIWLAFIGWFLEGAASASTRQLALQDALRGVKVRDVMTSECATIPPNMPVDELVQDYVMSTSRRCFMVVNDRGLEGMVTLHNIKEVPRDRWPEVTVTSIMTPAGELKTALPDEEVIGVLQRMDQADINQMPVVQDGQVVGLIARDNLLRLIATRNELRGK